MTAYPYVASHDKIGSLFKKIGQMGVPKKFNNKTLKSIGFTSSNDARLVSLVKFLGLTDHSGTPTPLWTELRKDPKTAIAKAVRTAYSELFQHHADANERDAEALRTYFAATSSLGSGAVGQMVTTFKALCRLGDFSSHEKLADLELESTREAPLPGTSVRQPAKVMSGADGWTVNINIQLQLPADATAETYDRFFEAMRKHIIAPAE